MAPSPHVSRRRFLTAAALGVAGLALEAGCSPDSGSRSGAAPRTSTSVPPLRAPTEAFEAKQALQTIATPVPRYIRTGPTDRARAALTIDDLWGAPNADNISQVLDVAKEKKVQMTFFPTGGAYADHIAANKQDVWKRVIDEGHEIGNHTYTHSQLPKLTDDQIKYELNHTQELLNQALGASGPYQMRLMRPPGGGGGERSGNARILGILAQLGYSMVMWSIDSNNTAGNASYAAKIASGAGNGSIVLLHFQTFAPGNFPGLMDRLHNERHLELTSVSGLFA